MIKTFLYLSVMLVAGALGASSSRAQKSTGEQFVIRGTVKHSDIEGGCWYFETQTGAKYELMTTDSSFLYLLHSEGRPLTLAVTKLLRVASTCMIGTIVHLDYVLDSVRHPIDMIAADEHIIGTVHRNKSGTWYVKATTGRKYSLGYPANAKWHIGQKYDEQCRTVRGDESEHGFFARIVGEAVNKQ